MVTQITRGIKISVLTTYVGKNMNPNNFDFVFNYRITIENNSKDSVQLMSRNWMVLDALDCIGYISGPGVVGQKPILNPGDTYTYESHCSLVAPYGAMSGYFNMVNFSTSKKFRVAVPSFKLHAPFALN